MCVYCRGRRWWCGDLHELKFQVQSSKFQQRNFFYKKRNSTLGTSHFELVTFFRCRITGVSSFIPFPSHPRPPRRGPRRHYRQGSRACLPSRRMRRRDRREVSGENREVDGLSQRVRWRSALSAAVQVTSITCAMIAVIALLCGIQNGIAAAGEGAIGSAAVRERIIIQCSIVTLFADVEHTVSAELTLVPAILSAAVDERGIVCRRFALLAQKFLYHSIAAHTFCTQTTTGTILRGVTLFTGVYLFVSTQRRRALPLAGGTASFGAITLFSGIQNLISAEREIE